MVTIPVAISFFVTWCLIVRPDCSRSAVVSGGAVSLGLFACAWTPNPILVMALVLAGVVAGMTARREVVDGQGAVLEPSRQG